jgi:hypothetical protein
MRDSSYLVDVDGEGGSTVKQAIALISVVSITACATVGTKIDATRVNDIKPCSTTEQELLTWFGQPARSGNQNGFPTMQWLYARAGLESDSQVLWVALNQKRQVIYYALNPTAMVVELRDSCGAAAN